MNIISTPYRVVQVYTWVLRIPIAIKPLLTSNGAYIAKRKLLEVLKDQKHVKVCSGEAGLFVSPNYPHLGASLDLIISWCFPMI